ncbi:MAG: hypothetical protein N4A59_14480, partial [Marinifilum sp.]|jgi:hypothetical protein|nr:hypothetical protein [Marinifilum sp.]
MSQQAYDKLNYYFSLQPALAKSFRSEQEREIRVVQMLLSLAEMGEQTELKDETQQKFEFLFKSYTE